MSSSGQPAGFVGQVANNIEKMNPASVITNDNGAIMGTCDGRKSSVWVVLKRRNRSIRLHVPQFDSTVCRSGGKLRIWQTAEFNISFSMRLQHPRRSESKSHTHNEPS